MAGRPPLEFCERGGGNHVRLAIAVGMVFLALTACSRGQAAHTAVSETGHAPPPPATVPTTDFTTPSQSPDPATALEFAKVSKLITDAIAANRLPGAVVVIGHGGQIAFHQAYGSRKLAGEPGLNGLPAPAEPMTEDTIFDLASLTKSLATATAVMQLYEQGIVQFDDPVQQYLPDFNTANDPVRANVTVRMLLTHTSGEPGDVELKDPWGLDQTDKAEGTHRALTTPLHWGPGEVFHYSDINFILLGALLERRHRRGRRHLRARTRICTPRHGRHPLSPCGQSMWSAHGERSCDWVGFRANRIRRLSGRYLERGSAVAHRTDSTGRRGQRRSGQESRSRSTAPRHRA